MKCINENQTCKRLVNLFLKLLGIWWKDIRIFFVDIWVKERVFGRFKVIDVYQFLAFPECWRGETSRLFIAINWWNFYGALKSSTEQFDDVVKNRFLLPRYLDIYYLNWVNWWTNKWFFIIKVEPCNKSAYFSKRLINSK